MDKDMRAKGKLTIWNERRGFGYITPMLGGKKLFIHIKAFRNRARHPTVGQIVTYELSTDKKGRPCAINASLTGDRLPEKVKSNSGSLPIVVAVLFPLVIGFLVFAEKIPLHILVFYIAMSLLTFIMYAIDKSAAKSGDWRTQESTLHLLSLAGGWPGALIAQQRLRHKSKKQPFRTVFWMTVLLNCAALVWMITSDSAIVLNSLFSRAMKDHAVLETVCNARSDAQGLPGIMFYS
jgi:uncharacterized membrane protein YsdA (DUF1294 family)/cold shock CspA family protein